MRVLNFSRPWLECCPSRSTKLSRPFRPIRNLLGVTRDRGPLSPNSALSRATITMQYYYWPRITNNDEKGHLVKFSCLIHFTWTNNYCRLVNSCGYTKIYICCLIYYFGRRSGRGLTYRITSCVYALTYTSEYYFMYFIVLHRGYY